MAYDVTAVKREWEGRETPLAWGRYPVEHDPIRRHCHMLDDPNPLFLEDGRCPPEDIFINTAFIRGCLCRVLTDWIGREGFVKALAFQMRGRASSATRSARGAASRARGRRGASASRSGSRTPVTASRRRAPPP